MRRRLLLFLCLLSSLFICIACNIKEASQPYTFISSAPHTLWHPPVQAQSRPIVQELDLKNEEYQECSEPSPLTLAESIDIALANNPNTKESWALARVSAAAYGQTLKDNFILASIEGNYSLTNSSAEQINKHRPYTTHYEMGLAFTYRILDFGQTRLSSKAALQSLFNANWSHNSHIQEIIQLTMNGYYYYLYQKQLLTLTEQNVINAELSLNATKEKFRQGIADISDIVQAKTGYLQHKLNLTNQKQLLHNAYTQFVNNMGLPANKVYYFENYPKNIDPIDLESLDILIIKANENRFDLLAREASVKSQRAALQASRLKHYPIITGTLNIGHKYDKNKLNHAYDVIAQINLSFPLFQGFYIANSIKAAHAKLESEEAKLKQIKLAIIREVSNYRSNVIHAQESVEYAQAYLSSAEEDYNVHLKKYQVGTGTIVDLMNAQSSVFDARSKLAQAQNNWYSSIVNLAYATGTLFPKQKEGNKSEKNNQ